VTEIRKLHVGAVTDWAERMWLICDHVDYNHCVSTGVGSKLWLVSLLPFQTENTEIQYPMNVGERLRLALMYR